MSSRERIPQEVSLYMREQSLYSKIRLSQSTDKNIRRLKQAGKPDLASQIRVNALKHKIDVHYDNTKPQQCDAELEKTFVDIDVSEDDLQTSVLSLKALYLMHELGRINNTTFSDVYGSFLSDFDPDEQDQIVDAFDKAVDNLRDRGLLNK